MRNFLKRLLGLVPQRTLSLAEFRGRLPVTNDDEQLRDWILKGQ